jgi:hypothetical protein
MIHLASQALVMTGVTDSGDPRDPFSSAFVPILSSGRAGLDQLTT